MTTEKEESVASKGMESQSRDNVCFSQEKRESERQQPVGGTQVQHLLFVRGEGERQLPANGVQVTNPAFHKRIGENQPSFFSATFKPGLTPYIPILCQSSQKTHTT